MKYTILVVTYNKEKYIRKCLDSIFNQTYKNFDLIIVDDGSTDNTKKIIDEYKKTYKFKYYYKENTGVGDSRNYAISKVKTKYFMFVDSDDYISLDILEQCSRYDNYDLLYFRGYKILESGKIVEKLDKTEFEELEGKKALHFLIKQNSLFLVPWGYMYNIDVLKQNKLYYEKEYVMEDVGLTPIIILNSKKVVSIKSYGYYYVQTEESIIRTNQQEKIDLKTRSILFHVDNLNLYISKNVKDKKMKNEYSDYFARLLLWYGTQLNKKNLNKYIKKLEERDVVRFLKIHGIIGNIKKILCCIDYKLYYNIYEKIKKLKIK